MLNKWSLMKGLCFSLVVLFFNECIYFLTNQFQFFHFLLSVLMVQKKKAVS
jgi:hypothetical protein